MDLILWRHADAHPMLDGQSDLERPLTPKGERQAKSMAAWLNQRLTRSTQVLVSPAMRTQETARALGRSFKTSAALQPLASVDNLLVAVHWPASDEPVLVVGHQPTLGLVASQLLSGISQPWHVKKAAVWWLRSCERSGQGTLLAVQAVDFL